MTNDGLLTINNLTISYGSKVAVQSVGFNINAGEVVSLVGESGSGKTTVLRSILSLMDKNAKVLEGEINLNGKNMLNLTAHRRERIAGSEVSMIFQNSENAFDAVHTLGSQLVECIRTHQKLNKVQAKALAIKVLSQFGFDNVEQVWNAYPFELSGGMCQRAAIAMAMVNKPKLLLADEPTSSLDAAIQSQVVKTLVSLKEKYNTSILMVTHDIGVAANMSDFIGVMYKGRLVEWGRKDEVLFQTQSPYTKYLLQSVKGMKNNLKNISLFGLNKYVVGDNKIYCSKTHWALEMYADE